MGMRADKILSLNAAPEIRNLGSYAAGCERHAVFVLLIGVQHAQGHCQLSSAVRYDGKGQRAASRLFTVVRQDVLVSAETQAPQLQPNLVL